MQNGAPQYPRFVERDARTLCGTRQVREARATALASALAAGALGGEHHRLAGAPLADRAAVAMAAVEREAGVSSGSVAGNVLCGNVDSSTEALAQAQASKEILLKQVACHTVDPWRTAQNSR